MLTDVDEHFVVSLEPGLLDNPQELAGTHLILSRLVGAAVGLTKDPAVNPCGLSISRPAQPKLLGPHRLCKAATQVGTVNKHGALGRISTRINAVLDIPRSWLVHVSGGRSFLGLLLRLRSALSGASTHKGSTYHMAPNQEHSGEGRTGLSVGCFNPATRQAHLFSLFQNCIVGILHEILPLLVTYQIRVYPGACPKRAGLPGSVPGSWKVYGHASDT